MDKFKYRDIFIKLGYLVIIIAFIYIIITQWHNLHGSLKLIKHSNPSDVLIVFAFIMVTYFSAAQSYYFLAFKELKILRTVMIQFAVATVNKIFPSGIGGLAANYVYLRKADHTKAQAVSVVGINNLLGLIANLFILTSLLLTVHTNKIIIHRPSTRNILVILSFIVIVFLLLVVSSNVRQKFKSGLKQVITELRSYRHRKDSLFFAFITQISLCLCFVLALYFSIHAVGADLTLSSVMLAFSFAIWLGAILPTPGGVGSIETGLTTALVAFGLNFETSLSAVLIFRLISFWLPFLFGGPALIWARRRRYL